MIVALIYPEVLDFIRSNAELRDRLAKANDVQPPAVNAMLRPQASGLPHSYRLTSISNMKLISEAYGHPVDSLYSEISID